MYINIESVTLTPQIVDVGSKFVISVKIQQSTHEKLKAFTHRMLSKFTHKQLGQNVVKP